MVLGEAPLTFYFKKVPKPLSPKGKVRKTPLKRHKVEDTDVAGPSSSITTAQSSLDEHFSTPTNKQARHSKRLVSSDSRVHPRLSITKQLPIPPITDVKRRLLPHANIGSSLFPMSSTLQRTKRRIASPPSSPNQKRHRCEPATHKPNSRSSWFMPPITNQEVDGFLQQGEESDLVVLPSQIRDYSDHENEHPIPSISPSSEVNSPVLDFSSKHLTECSDADNVDEVIPSSQSQPPLVMDEVTPIVLVGCQLDTDYQFSTDEFIPSSQSQEMGLSIDKEERKQLHNLTKNLYSSSAYYGSTPNTSANPVVRTFSDELFRVPIHNNLFADIFEESVEREEGYQLPFAVPGQKNAIDEQSVTESESDEEWYLKRTPRKTTSTPSSSKIRLDSKPAQYTDYPHDADADDERSSTRSITPDPVLQHPPSGKVDNADDESSIGSTTPDPVPQHVAVQEFEKMFANADDDSSYPPDFPMSLRF